LKKSDIFKKIKKTTFSKKENVIMSIIKNIALRKFLFH